MIAPDRYQCRICKVRAFCYPVPVSRLEEGLGHEKFRCERCGSLFKLIPDRTSGVRLGPPRHTSTTLHVIEVRI